MGRVELYRQPSIDVRSDGAVRIVTLNEPDALNAFTEDLHEQFVDVWADVERDSECRAVVLTGAGRAFSAGGSYEDFEHRRVDLAARRYSLRLARRLVDEMIEVAVPVVAAVNGPAVGLGCTVVTLCDIVFIAETAFLSDTHVAVALVAGDGGAVTWPAHTSLLRAKQYLLTGDRLAATEAVDLGLANFVVPGDRLIEEATAYAHRLAALPPQAVQETKALLNQHLRANAVRALGLGLATEYQSHEQPEYREAGERLRTRDR
ncbi:MAG: enoyl-CoA hydratase/isomerase family protein [Actinobacteria bacterium]|nr:enoyl-CoA hydratase/isomerase family protein [Actinomycetota bacterium]